MFFPMPPTDSIEDLVNKLKIYTNHWTKRGYMITGMINIKEQQILKSIESLNNNYCIFVFFFADKFK